MLRLIFGRDNEQASESDNRTRGAPKCETDDMFNFNAFSNKRFKIRQNKRPLLYLYRVTREDVAQERERN